MTGTVFQEKKSYFFKPSFLNNRLFFPLVESTGKKRYKKIVEEFTTRDRIHIIFLYKQNVIKILSLLKNQILWEHIGYNENIFLNLPSPYIQLQRKPLLVIWYGPF